MLIIYLAGRYGRRAELAGYREELNRFVVNAEVQASWLDGEHEASDGDIMNVPELAYECSSVDLRDIEAADLVISFTGGDGPGSQRGGRHVEFGYALAKGKMLMIVGPPESIFHHAAGVMQYGTWSSCLIAVARLSAAWARLGARLRGE